MRNYYTRLGPPPEDPIAAGLAALAASNKGEFKPSDITIGEDPGMGAPGVDPTSPGDLDYWKGRLRQDMRQQELMEQDMNALPMGAQTMGPMYA